MSDTLPSVFAAHALERPVGNEPGAIRRRLFKPLSNAPDLAKLEGGCSAKCGRSAASPSNQIKGAETKGQHRDVERPAHGAAHRKSLSPVEAVWIIE